VTTIRLQDLSHRLGGREVLRGVNLAFPEGAISLLLGPNGAGKTTLLRLCAFLERPTRGQVMLEGEGAAERSDRRRVTMVFQRPVLFARTVRANLAYPLKVRGLPRAERRERIAEALAVAGLEPLAHQQARRLSGGEAQRLALARAYAVRPEVLLLDEPSANLDPESRQRIEAMLRGMRARFGTTIVFTSHDLFHARRIGEAVYFVSEGVVRGPRTVPEFFAHPPGSAEAAYIQGVVEAFPE
jgi:tungstate transport system ATP-binding protein